MGTLGTQLSTQTTIILDEFMSFQKERDSVYPMDTSPRGLMLIINNKNFPMFPEGSRERRGTDIDAIKLQGMFINFGFEVIRTDNLTAEVSVNVKAYSH